MTRRKLLPVAAFLLCAATLPASTAPPESGAWRASSSNAKSITGDIGFGTERLILNFTPIPISRIRDLSPAEVNAVFNLDQGPAPGGSLYRVAIAADRVFLHKNTLCGTDDTQWIAVAFIGRQLQVAFFSGAQPPNFNAEALINSTAVCGIFTYAR